MSNILTVIGVAVATQLGIIGCILLCGWMMRKRIAATAQEQAMSSLVGGLDEDTD